MSSLTEQMELLQKQQEILAEKIKEEELRKKKESYTIEGLEILNQGQKESINKYKYKRDGFVGRALQQARLMTMPRFDVILEILKKQEIRIEKLESIIKKQDARIRELEGNKVGSYELELPCNR